MEEVLMNQKPFDQTCQLFILSSYFYCRTKQTDSFHVYISVYLNVGCSDLVDKRNPKDVNSPKLTGRTNVTGMSCISILTLSALTGQPEKWKQLRVLHEAAVDS